jgi:hypothetical protein
MMTTAAELYRRQMRYDLLHHRRRLDWLRGLARPSHFERGLITQSEACLARPSLAYNSVDVRDAAYVRELDEFAALPLAA